MDQTDYVCGTAVCCTHESVVRVAHYGIGVNRETGVYREVCREREVGCSGGEEFILPVDIHSALAGRTACNAQYDTLGCSSTMGCTLGYNGMLWDAHTIGYHGMQPGI